MAIQEWSDDIMIAGPGEDPQFSDELDNLADKLQSRPANAVLDFAAVVFINSSNISKLLRLRKQIQADHRRLIICNVNTQIWGVFMVTGLEKVFEFSDDISTALAALQIAD